MNHKRRRFLRIVVLLAAATLALLVYFPGRQTPIAFTLATGIGATRLQERVSTLEEKAIKHLPFTEEETTFLHNLYTCFAKGGRLTIIFRQTSQMMNRYLSGTGEDLRTNPRIFIKSQPVQVEMDRIRQRMIKDSKDSVASKGPYSSQTFYMGDPTFFDSIAGLYFGRITATPETTSKGTLVIHWRAECPWEWPSYESLYKTYGDYHAQCFPLPNVRSVIFGSRYDLSVDDGLGGYLVNLGLAKSFLVYSEWIETLVIR